MMTPPAAVLFDMDGTLVHTDPVWAEAEKQIVAERGGTWTDIESYELIGVDLITASKLIISETGISLEPATMVELMVDHVVNHIRQDGPIFQPGAKHLLATLRAKGVPIALVTSSWRRLALAVAEECGGFDVIIGGDDVANSKPHPEPYLRAARALGADITQCVAIEDSGPGLESALASGARTVAVPSTVQVDYDPRLSRIQDLSNLTLSVLSNIVAGHKVVDVKV